MKIPFTTSDEIARNLKKGQLVMLVRPNAPEPNADNINGFAETWMEWGIVRRWLNDDRIVVAMVSPLVRPPKLTGEVRSIDFDDIVGIYS